MDRSRRDRPSSFSAWQTRSTPSFETKRRLTVISAVSGMRLRASPAETMVAETMSHQWSSVGLGQAARNFA